MEYSIEVLFLDLMKASILILISHIIRSKVKFIQNLYIPSSLLAGFSIYGYCFFCNSIWKFFIGEA